MSTNKKVINPVYGGGISLSHTIKANYFKMGIRNFLFTKRDGFDATEIVLEYE